MNHNTQHFFGIDPNSQDMADLIQVAAHYIGGMDRLISCLEGTKYGSRTMLSDSYSLVTALAQGAIDLNKPAIAVALCQSYMATYGYAKDSLTEEEVVDLEVLFLSAFAAAQPDVAKAFGITPEALAQYPAYAKSRAANGNKNL